MEPWVQHLDRLLESCVARPSVRVLQVALIPSCVLLPYQNQIQGGKKSVNESVLHLSTVWTFFLELFTLVFSNETAHFAALSIINGAFYLQYITLDLFYKNDSKLLHFCRSCNDFTCKIYDKLTDCDQLPTETSDSTLEIPHDAKPCITVSLWSVTTNGRGVRKIPYILC